MKLFNVLVVAIAAVMKIVSTIFMTELALNDNNKINYTNFVIRFALDDNNKKFI